MPGMLVNSIIRTTSEDLLNHFHRWAVVPTTILQKNISISKRRFLIPDFMTYSNIHNP